MKEMDVEMEERREIEEEKKEKGERGGVRKRERTGRTKRTGTIQATTRVTSSNLQCKTKRKRAAHHN